MMMKIKVILIVILLFVAIAIQLKLNLSQRQKVNFVSYALVIGSNLRLIFKFKMELNSIFKFCLKGKPV